MEKDMKKDIKDLIQKEEPNLNNLLEKMILKNPEQWIWSHNRWK